eukprot:TRINITY_DN247_c0_g1_i1.p1 TRINITY_DN247_c0_g1~~TRINITY_DN247_c0_g1_i1.p1  ORF type:complete len:208 (+),score=75.44 TRINITY_DN247_c0_g1_i1:83-625(+)
MCIRDRVSTQSTWGIYKNNLQMKAIVFVLALVAAVSCWNDPWETRHTIKIEVPINGFKQCFPYLKSIVTTVVNIVKDIENKQVEKGLTDVKTLAINAPTFIRACNPEITSSYNGARIPLYTKPRVECADRVKNITELIEQARQDGRDLKKLLPTLNQLIINGKGAVVECGEAAKDQRKKF